MKCRAGLLLLVFAALSAGQQISGELKQWHDVTLTFDGPATSESAEPNPFLFYRLNVTFAKGSRKYVVPGYYAADGNAAETSAKSGNKWRVHFVPDETGEWTYSVSFRSGAEVAASLDSNAGQPASSGRRQGKLEDRSFRQVRTRSSGAGNAGIRGRTLCSLPRVGQVFHPDRYSESREFPRLFRI